VGEDYTVVAYFHFYPKEMGYKFNHRNKNFVVLFA